MTIGHVSSRVILLKKIIEEFVEEHIAREKPKAEYMVQMMKNMDKEMY